MISSCTVCSLVLYWFCPLNMKYKNVCVHSKGALVVLATSILLSTTAIIGGLLTKLIENYSYITFAAIGLRYIFYPLLGLLGEKWMRYKVLLVGIILTFVGFFISMVILVALHFLHLNSIAVVGICLVLSFPYFFGYGIFQANVIQFGTDQLQFSPSRELSSFVYWVFYIEFFLLAFTLLSASTITHFYYKYTFYFLFSGIIGYGVLIVIIAVLSFCCFKHHLVIEPAQHNNPVKLIWKVIKYTWTHKQPVRRSAFTYGEAPPSGLDLGKERYGGPFTTVQVEDVKSFLYILSIILGIFGYGFNDTKTKISEQYLIFMQTARPNSFMESLLLTYPLTVQSLVIVFFVPLYQFVIIPFFSHCIPGMLKRIWIGLVALLVESIMTALISYFMTRDIRNALNVSDLCFSFTNNITFENELQSDELTLPFYIMAVPQFFVGVSILLVHFTSFEFILAQGPRTMQGLLIGIWFMHNSIYCVHLTLGSSQYGCYWEYYAVKTGVVFISVIVYTIAAYKYKYRQRNELSDVNERVIITEYTERQLEQEYCIEDEDEDNVTITSVNYI